MVAPSQYGPAPADIRRSFFREVYHIFGSRSKNSVSSMRDILFSLAHSLQSLEAAETAEIVPVFWAKNSVSSVNSVRDILPLARSLKSLEAAEAAEKAEIHQGSLAIYKAF